MSPKYSRTFKTFRCPSCNELLKISRRNCVISSWDNKESKETPVEEGFFSKLGKQIIKKINFGIYFIGLVTTLGAILYWVYLELFPK